MTQLPFEDLPAKRPTGALFQEWWPKFWADWPNKVDRQAAAILFCKLLRTEDPTKIIEGRDSYIRNKPDWRAWMGPAKFLRNRRWEDEYDTPYKTIDYGRKSELALQQIAEHVKKPWYQFGTYPRDVLQECVDAKLLTDEEAEAKS